MKREELKEIGLDGETIDKIMALHGRDTEAGKAEAAKLTDELNTARAELEKHRETIKKLETSGADADAVKAELEALKKKIAEDTEKAEQAKNFDDFREMVKSALDGKEFVNDYTAESITRSLYAMRQDKANANKGVKDMLDELTKDKAGIFKNPNEPPDMPRIQNRGNGEEGWGINEDILRQAMGLPPNK